jgi:hypothetical protein
MPVASSLEPIYKAFLRTELFGSGDAGLGRQELIERQGQKLKRNIVP